MDLLNFPTVQILHFQFSNIKLKEKKTEEEKREEQRREEEARKKLENRQKKLLKFLVGKGADINKQKEYGLTPLHIVAFSGDTELVKLLLNLGSNPNIQDINGLTPLHYASQAGYDGIVELLISKGGNPDIADYYHKKPSFYSNRYKNLTPREKELHEAFKKGDYKKMEDFRDNKTEVLKSYCEKRISYPKDEEKAFEVLKNRG